MNNSKMDAFAVLMAVLQSIANQMQLLWTIFLSIEQVQTGWGYGTNFELAILWPWLLEILCAPVLFAGTLYIVLTFFYPHRKKLMAANITLFVLLVGQYLVTNLFIWF